jgi:hypothetical protein
VAADSFKARDLAATYGAFANSCSAGGTIAVETTLVH